VLENPFDYGWITRAALPDLEGKTAGFPLRIE
jgi:hypothetical protein